MFGNSIFDPSQTVKNASPILRLSAYFAIVSFFIAVRLPEEPLFFSERILFGRYPKYLFKIHHFFLKILVKLLNNLLW